MNPNDVAPMVMAITLFLVVGGVILLRPITKRLGSLLEVMTQQKRERVAGAEDPELRRYVANLESRLSLLEERQNFTEALLASGDRGEARVKPERATVAPGSAARADPGT